MFINNLKLINKAFDVLKEEEEKINYYYEPRFCKNKKNWKRHMNFYELKRDFIKDIIDYGFCPYIENTSEEQMKNKNIMKFSKEKNHDYTNHIKKLNYLINNKKKFYKKNNYKSNSCGSIKISKIKLQKIPKINEYKNKSILSVLYNSTNEQNFSGANKRINSAKILNFENKNKKKITKIVKFSRDDIFDYIKMKKDKLLENQLNKSLSFESDEDYKNTDNFSLVENNQKKFGDKGIKILRNSIFNQQTNLKNKLKIKPSCNSQIIKNPLDKNLKSNQSNQSNQSIHKINNNQKDSNSYLMKDTSNSTFFGQGKKEIDYLLNSNKEYSNKHNMRYSQKITSIEKLENASGGIFRIARKYNYYARKNKKIKQKLFK